MATREPQTDVGNPDDSRMDRVTHHDTVSSLRFAFEGACPPGSGIGPKASVNTGTNQKRRVGPSFDDSPPFEDQDPVRATDGRESMGDDENGSARNELAQGLLDEGFVVGVHQDGGFIQDQDGGVAQESPCDGEPLALPGRECCAPQADDRVVTVRQLHNEIIGPGGPNRGLDLVGRSPGPSHAEIRRHRVFKEKRLLKHKAHLLHQLLDGHLPDIDSSHENGSGRDVPEARDEPNDGGFPGSRRPHEGSECSLAGEEGHLFQRGVIRFVIGKAYLPEFNGAAVQRQVTARVGQPRRIEKLLDFAPGAYHHGKPHRLKVEVQKRHGIPRANHQKDHKVRVGDSSGPVQPQPDGQQEGQGRSHERVEDRSQRAKRSGPRLLSRRMAFGGLLGVLEGHSPPVEQMQSSQASEQLRQGSVPNAPGPIH